MKISKHFTTSALTAGFWLALVGSGWLYGAMLGITWRPLYSALGLLFLYYLLSASRAVWFWSGFFIGVLWFWWIGVSFYYYHLAWLIPIAILGVAIIYGFIFYAIAYLSEKISYYFSLKNKSLSTLNSQLSTLTTKAFGLLVVSYLHPIGFDWFKPELVFVPSAFGITKWQLAVVLLSIVLAHWRRQPFWLFLSLAAYSHIHIHILHDDPSRTIKIIATHTTIADKWNPNKRTEHIRNVVDTLDKAIDEHYKVVIFPESVLPLFLNKNPALLDRLNQRSHQIDIIIGALYWDHGVHRNSTYFFHQGHYAVANKVVLVPFGEANPLPDFASRWVNRIFFDGAVDYTASAHPTDWTIRGTSYRNAICYESTSERLYADPPKRMIVTSNNAWFVPSVEPTFQRLLLTYYVRKYGITIYHATNMSPAYILRRNIP